MKKDPKGSNWRKWDLHVHTPESIIQNYPGDKEKRWEAFLDDLENLPEEFKVIGINDYIFLDGYRRVLEERKKGRLSNIALILPIVELRVDMFGGSDKLSRINFHAVFSDEVSADNIQSQFINALEKTYYLDSNKTQWNAVPTRDSLRDFGQTLIDKTPLDKRTDLPSAEKHGFNNLNFNIDDIRKRLENNYFENKHLTAIGKTEWANFPWQNQFIADKKSLIFGVDFVLTASKTVDEYKNGVEGLKKAGVNSHLIHASDAHALSTSDKPNRIGNSLTWIKSDTTFDGLRQALKRFNQRVFVGEIPEKIESVKDNQTKHIKSIKLEKTKPDFDEVWFDDIEIAFNHGLVAIIGNKGSAKSALTDIIGLLGDSGCDVSDFSFLHKDKFHKKPESKSKHFKATIVWESSVETTKNLDGTRTEYSVELVKYIPQNFFEKVCNEIAKGNFTNFDVELKNVIFSHVEIPDRLGKTSLDDLITHKTEEIGLTIDNLKTELKRHNREIVEKEKQLTEEYKSSLQSKLELKKSELQAHISNKPQEVPDPSSLSSTAKKTTKEINQKKQAITKLDDEIESSKAKQIQLSNDSSNLEKAQHRVKAFQDSYETFKREFSSLNLKNLDVEFIVEISVNKTTLETEQKRVVAELGDIETKLDGNNPLSLIGQKKILESEINVLQKTLDEPSKAFHNYQKKLQNWELEKKEIEENKPHNSIKYYADRLKEIDNLPNEIKSLEVLRHGISKNIFEQIERKVTEFEKLYAPVQKFIREHPLAQEFDLNFDVSIVNRNFEKHFFEFIDQGKSGTFHGKQKGSEFLETIASENNFDTSENALKFATDFVDSLKNDKRDSKSETKEVKEQIKGDKTVESLYDFLFSFDYLEPHFVLKMLDKEMIQLSPGEKGTLLLVFYLLIDKDNIPLIIDQPEENLDNETVVKFLVPAIEEAKKRRQVFIVTHNPNLAVVCDAEQVIRANIDKKSKNKVEYICGSIENPDMNLHLLDVLEGTSRAFKIRHSSYSLTE
jgi:ABC-type lipoprotein export system ATPase subunit